MKKEWIQLKNDGRSRLDILFFFKLYLIHNVLVSSIQQNNCYAYVFFRFFYIIDYYRILNIVPCAISRSL